jgi:hypothetical protein
MKDIATKVEDENAQLRAEMQVQQQEIRQLRARSYTYGN